MRGSGIVTSGLLALALTACGSGGGGGGDSGSSNLPAATVNYVPMEGGDRWLYQASDSSSPSVLLPRPVQLQNTSLLDGSPALLQRSDYFDRESYSLSRLVKTADGVKQVFDASDGLPFSSWGSLPLFRLPLRSGDHYMAFLLTNQDSGSDTDGDGIHERFTLREDIEVGDVESVTVPAGTFNNAIKLTLISRMQTTYSQDGRSSSFGSTTLHWYVPGIGLVKVSTALLPGPTTTLELQGYNVGGHSTDTTPPVVLATTISSHQLPTDIRRINTTFSELMDRQSLTEGSFVIKDATATPVSGLLNYGTDGLLFTADAPMPPGTYTAHLESAKDALGNALAAPYVATITVP